MSGTRSKGRQPAPARVPAGAVAIANRQQARRINAAALRRIARAAFAELGVDRADLGIRLVDAQEMARVNWQFLQHEGSTDVITFDYREDNIESPAGPRVHGELVICVADAIQQAREFRTTWESEVVRYVVHGILHLLGYDDLKPVPRRAMKREENRLVRRLERTFSFAQLSRQARIRQ